MEPSSNGHLPGRCLTGFYAVVSYLPEPLAGFLDALRAEITPGCQIRSHLTILPPRPLSAPPATLSGDLQHLLADSPCADVRLGPVEFFESSRVAYLSLSSGREHIEELHRILSGKSLAAADYFPFHPHVTLGQEIASGDCARVLELARRRWRECPHSPVFTLQSLTLVRSTGPGRWETISEHAPLPATLLRTA